MSTGPRISQKVQAISSNERIFDSCLIAKDIRRNGIANASLVFTMLVARRTRHSLSCFISFEKHRDMSAILSCYATMRIKWKFFIRREKLDSSMSCDICTRHRTALLLSDACFHAGCFFPNDRRIFIDSALSRCYSRCLRKILPLCGKVNGTQIG